MREKKDKERGAFDYKEDRKDDETQCFFSHTCLSLPNSWHMKLKELWDFDHEWDESYFSMKI